MFFYYWELCSSRSGGLRPPGPPAPASRPAGRPPAGCPGDPGSWPAAWLSFCSRKMAGSRRTGTRAWPIQARGDGLWPWCALVCLPAATRRKPFHGCHFVVILHEVPLYFYIRVYLQELSNTKKLTIIMVFYYIFWNILMQSWL